MVPADEFLDVNKFDQFITLRAEQLANRATAYIQQLGSA